MLKILQFILTIGFFSGLSLNAFAIGTSEPPIKKGAPITIKSFDAMTRAVEVTLVNEPAVGPNYADINDLAAALGFSGKEAEKFKKEPMSQKGVVHNLKSQLKLLNFYELKRRLPKKVQQQMDEAARKAKAKADAVKAEKNQKNTKPKSSKKAH